MNKLQIFNNEEFGSIRTVTIDNEPWLVGKDVAVALGYSNTRDALRQHVDSEDRQTIQRSENMTFEIPNRGMTIINESGLYALIFGSRLPSAKRFKHWVTSEVLPALRKTGTYSFRQAEPKADGLTGAYKPTRPLTTDDYLEAGRIIKECHNSRLPTVLDLYRKAGLDLREISKINIPTAGYTKCFDIDKFDRYLREHGISSLGLSKVLKCSPETPRRWRNGIISPGNYYRDKICEALELPKGYFDEEDGEDEESDCSVF